MLLGAVDARDDEPSEGSHVLAKLMSALEGLFAQTLLALAYQGGYHVY